jgi:hypothetical protein
MLPCVALGTPRSHLPVMLPPGSISRLPPGEFSEPPPETPGRLQEVRANSPELSVCKTGGDEILRCIERESDGRVCAFVQHSRSAFGPLGGS